jgi:hypothetical protein
MSTTYGAPLEVVSVDPLTGAQTELADTSITNLLAELPVLETQANGVNLGLQPADGTQVQFASTAQLATFLYSLAVQQMQATSFVTDNDNLDMQWLGTVDQPLLQEALYWSERATAEASSHPAGYGGDDRAKPKGEGSALDPPRATGPWIPLMGFGEGGLKARSEPRWRPPFTKTQERISKAVGL